MESVRKGERGREGGRERDERKMKDKRMLNFCLIIHHNLYRPNPLHFKDITHTQMQIV